MDQSPQSTSTTRTYKSGLIKVKAPVNNYTKVSEKSPSSRNSLHSGRNNRMTGNLFSHRPQHSCSPGFTFSKIARFESDIFEKFKRIIQVDMSPMFSSSMFKSKDSIKEIIESNKNVHKFSPQQKSLRIKNLSIQGDLRRETIKLRKFDILNSIKIEKRNKLLEKFRKFEIRQNKVVSAKQDAISTKKAWIILYLSCGLCFISKNAIINRKILKLRVAKSLKWLRSVSRCIGRLRFIIKQTRRNISLKVKKN